MLNLQGNRLINTLMTLWWAVNRQKQGLLAMDPLP